MCITPSYIEGIGQVPCRNCWQCDRNRVNDLVGRAIAETYTCSDVWTVTLTYRDDVPNAAVLVYQDIINLFKRMRSAGIKFRYMVAGEYGSKKGRAHWHCVLFFYENAPKHVLEFEREDDTQVVADTRINWRYWPHGFTYWQKPDYGTYSYILKYVLKEYRTDGNVNKFQCSKKPPLGAFYFIELANQLIQMKLPPQSPQYAFDDDVDSKGRRRKYWLQGRMREIYVMYYRWAYFNQWGEDCPENDFTRWDEDRHARAIAWQDFSDFRFMQQVGENAKMRSAARAAEEYEQDKADYIKRQEYEASDKYVPPPAMAFAPTEYHRIETNYVVDAQSGTIVTVYQDNSADFIVEGEKWAVADVNQIEETLVHILPRPEVERLTKAVQAALDRTNRNVASPSLTPPRTT